MVILLLIFYVIQKTFYIITRFDDNLATNRQTGIGRQTSERRLRAASEANLLAGQSNIRGM